MDSFIDGLRSSSTVVQALAASAGGLIGVFATLTLFFAMMRVAVRREKDKGDQAACE